MAQILNQNSFAMAEYSERTGKFVWMRLLPITEREAVEEWVRLQFAPPTLNPSKNADPKASAKAR